jgi:hypothetical protein
LYDEIPEILRAPRRTLAGQFFLASSAWTLADSALQRLTALNRMDNPTFAMSLVFADEEFRVVSRLL